MPEPRATLGIFRPHLTSPEHRRHITVGRQAMLDDTLEMLRKNAGRKPSRHLLFVAPRGSGKTHFISLIEDEIQRDAALNKAYLVVRFPEEARRVLSYADFLLTICEVLRENTAAPGAPSPWRELYDTLSTEEDEHVIIDTIVPAIKQYVHKHKLTLVLMIENLHQFMEEQLKKETSIKALRGFLMGDNGCLLIATAPMFFGAHTKPDQPFYDFFDTQVLDQLSVDETIAFIRKSLEWDKLEDLLKDFATLEPKLRAIYKLTGGSPRLTVMLYELLATESVTAVKQQFMLLLDRITPFYQERLNDLSPQERAVLETIATMRDSWGKPAEPKTPGNIAKLMRMDQSHVSSLLGRLAKSLYLTATTNPEDGRSQLYVIREGFFDLWLAMNISRTARIRIPFLTEFFAAFYEQEDYRRQKKEEYFERLERGEFDENAAEALMHLTNIGKPEEISLDKIKLAATLRAKGETERPAFLKGEIQASPMDQTGRWIVDHLDEPHPNYLNDILDLINCWDSQRQGGLEAFAQRLYEMGSKLSYKNWSKLRTDFLRDHLDTMPLNRERVVTRLKLAFHYNEVAQWPDADQQGREALAEAEKLNSAELITWACNDRAHLLQTTNRLGEAEPLMRRALALAETTFGKDHSKVALCLNNLAQVLQDTNRRSEAELLMRRALTIDEVNFGKNHPTVATRLSNLAQLLQDTNRRSEAELLMRRALAIDEVSFAEDHPRIASRLNNLALLLQATNRLSEAEPLMRRALAIDEVSFGKDHPTVAIRLNNLAQLLYVTNRFTEAEPLMLRALAINEVSFGKDHPVVALCLNNLSQLLQATNRSNEAKPLARRALDISKKSLGEEHPNTKAVAENLRILLDKLRQ